MFNIRIVNSPVKVGNGKTMISMKIGDVRVRKGTEELTTTDVKYVPEL